MIRFLRPLLYISTIAAALPGAALAQQPVMGREVYPSADTDFYSRAYENIYATPFTHTGGLLTLHATSTLDIVAGVVRGWDLLKDNNDMMSFHGAFVWSSSDKRYSWTTTWITGPEQPDNNRDDRTLVTSYLTAKFGSQMQWVLSTGQFRL